ncbi:MAG: hypothetical protein ABI547_06775, partial [Betaproteobacteria bacterium]
LDWLANLSYKTDHPMYCIEEAERLLTGLSDEPLKAVEEVASWLTTLAQAAGFRPAVRLAVVKRVDESGQPFELELNRLYLAPGALTEFERQQMWHAALHFWERVDQAYRLCLQELPGRAKSRRAQTTDIALLVVRVLHALASQVRLLRLRYMPVRESLWQTLFDMFRLSEEAGCDNLRVEAYAGHISLTTARQELLNALLLEIARPDSMLPRQTDIVARVAARYANACHFEARPKAECNWTFDLARPRPPELAAAAEISQPTARFFGTAAVTAKIREVIRRLTTEPSAKEQRFGAEYTAPEKLAVLNRLMDYWGEQPPRRREQRMDAAAALEVILGFADAWRKVPRARYRDWPELVLGLDPKLLARLGINSDPATLRMPEKWRLHDTSPWGIGAELPRTSELAVRIGTLCALQTGDNPWWLGVVRRLFRESEDQALAGIEVLAKKPATVLLRRVAHGGMSVQNWSSAADASGSDYMNALLLGASRAGGERLELLVARGEFIAALVYEAMIGEAKQYFKFEELLEQGTDFDRVRFTRVARADQGGAPT